MGERSSAKPYMKKHVKGLCGRERGHLGFPMLRNKAAIALGEQHADKRVLGALSPKVLLKMGQRWYLHRLLISPYLWKQKARRSPKT